MQNNIINSQNRKTYKDINSILVHYMTTRVLKSNKTIEAINFDIYYHLKEYNYTDDEIFNYVDFDLKVDDNEEYVEVIPLNLVTALWFCNVFPKDLPEKDATEIIVDKKKYTYNRYKLKIKDAKK